MSDTRKRKKNNAAQARQNILAQWRGADISPIEKTLTATARPASKLMPKVLAGLGLDRRRIEAEVARVWNNLIDPNIVAHAHPARLVKGTLFVNIDSSVWLNEIVRYRRHEILQRLQSSFGPELIARISYRIG